MAKTLPENTVNNFSELMEKAGMTCQEVSEKYSIGLRTVYRWVKENTESAARTLVSNQLKEIIRLGNTRNLPQANTNTFTYIDLFAGIGGFRKAFDSIGGQCVFTSEWDKACRMTYQANYDCSHPLVGDIREYTKNEESLAKIPRHDVLVGGFPCQPFSIAGVSKKNSLGRQHGFKCDTQGTLFFDLAQIIEHHRPPAFLLENVKNLTSHDKGNTFRIIRRTLEEELGYKIDCRIIDGRSWVPQHRERIFIVGFREDVGFDFNKFEIPSNTPVLGDILHKTNGTEDDEPPFLVGGTVASKYTLSEKLWDYLQRYKEKHLAKGNGFGFGLFGANDVARTLSARYYKDGAEILIKQRGTRPRRLTPRECSRLMGFDAPNESNFKIPVSDTQAYRQFGNSVIAPLARAVAEFMRPNIIEILRRNNNQIVIPFDGQQEIARTANA